MSDGEDLADRAELQKALENDANTISQILTNFEFANALEHVGKYSFLPSHKRVQRVLNDYFNRAARDVSYETLYKEGLFIQKIFPTVSINDILGMLREIAYEENSVRFVIRKLLLTTKSDSSKRNHSSSSLNIENKLSEFKRVKVEVETITNEPLTSKNCDDSFVLNGHLSSENADAKEIKMNNAAACTSNNTEQTLIETESNSNELLDFNHMLDAEEKPAETVESYNTNDTMASTSQHQSLEMDSQATIIVSPEITEPPVLDNHHVVESSNKIQETPLYEIASSSTNDDNRSALKMKIIKRTSEPSTSKAYQDIPEDSEANSKFNFLDNLREMFSTVSKSHFEKVIRSYSIRQNTQPTEAVYDAIVSDLLSFKPSDDSLSDEDNDDNGGMFSRLQRKECARTSGLNASSSLSTSRNLPTNSTVTKSQIINLSSLATVSKAPDTNTKLQTLNDINQNTTKKSVGSNNFINNLNEVLADLRETVANEEIQNDVGEMFTENDYNFESEDPKVYQTLICPLMEMFPVACPQYIRKICHGKQNDPGVLDELISLMLSVDYPKRKIVASPERNVTLDDQLETMKQILPDADPNYLQIQCESLYDQPEAFKAFIANLLEKRQYPTMKDYLRKQQLSAQQKQYTTDFSVPKFLEVIPDPVGYFTDKNRKTAVLSQDGVHYALCFLRNHYPKIHLNKIREIFKSRQSNLLKTCAALETVNPIMHMKSKRSFCRMPEAVQDIPVLQEIAYVEHQNEILRYIEEQRFKEKIERDNAKINGLFKTCGCCFDEEVLPKHIYMCENGCTFCMDCVKKGVEVAFGDGKLDFLCLNNCSANFSLQTLQAVLNPKMFSIIALKKQVEEVKAAGIEDLEVCPFCDFATIPARDDKLFRCLNPECMKESCRLCKEPSHVPLRCDEVEKEDDVKNRIYIENKMTEALLRKCYKCGLKFIKAEGCNKMTCSCGAMMCYVCGEPVKDYKHFNGAGNDQFQLCPLYSDTNKLHETAVLEGATKAKHEIGVDSNPKKLKFDPTADVKEHYKEQAKNNPAPRVPQYVDPFPAAVHRHVLIAQQRMAFQNVQQEQPRNALEDLLGLLPHQLLRPRNDPHHRHHHRRRNNHEHP